MTQTDRPFERCILRSSDPERIISRLGLGFHLYPGRTKDFGPASAEVRLSGWLIGEQTTAKQAGMIAAKYGDGRVILFGLRPHQGAQTHGTFKLLFNALVR